MCVCKSWRSYIKHPWFIDAHLEHQRRDLLMIQTYPEGTEKQIYSLHVDDYTFLEYKKHESPLIHPVRAEYRVVGSCNGILCITNDQNGYGYDTYLWNPTIRKSVVVPYPNVTYYSHGGFDQAMGFGFDANTNDYKVIRIVELVRDYKHQLGVELYTLSTGIWRNISHLAPAIRCMVQISYPERARQAYLNGAAHWIVYERCTSFSHRLVILVFHFGDEKFSCIEPPAGNSYKFRCDDWWPGNFGGSLSIVEHSKDRCCVWVMKEYGDSSSWTRQLDISVCGEVKGIFGFRKDGDLLIGINGGLYSYDPDKEPHFLRESNQYFWNLFQQDYHRVYYNRADDDQSYDPEAAPKDLQLRSRKMLNNHRRYSFHCECYTESLVLLGAMMSVEDDQVQSIHDQMQDMHLERVRKMF